MRPTHTFAILAAFGLTSVAAAQISFKNGAVVKDLPPLPEALQEQKPTAKPAVRSELTDPFLSELVAAAAIGDEGHAEKLASGIQTAAGNAKRTQQLILLAYKWEQKASPIDTTLMALQVAQNQKIIEQNQKIIDLLASK